MEAAATIATRPKLSGEPALEDEAALAILPASHALLGREIGFLARLDVTRSGGRRRLENQDATHESPFPCQGVMRS